MKKYLMRWFVFLFIFFTFEGCFEIVHYLDWKQDGSVESSWSFSISSALLNDKSLPGGGAAKENIPEKFKNSQDEVKGKIGQYVKDLKFQETKDEFEYGFEIQYTIKDLKQLPDKLMVEDGYPLLPRYSQKRNSLIFTFMPKDKNGKNAEDTTLLHPINDVKTPAPPSPEEDNQQVDPFGGGMEKILSQVMSSASYKIVLGGEFKPVMAKVHSLNSEKTYELRIQKMGSLRLVKVPFMTLFLKEKKGFHVVVYLASDSTSK